MYTVGLDNPHILAKSEMLIVPFMYLAVFLFDFDTGFGRSIDYQKIDVFWNGFPEFEQFHTDRKALLEKIQREGSSSGGP